MKKMEKVIGKVVNTVTDSVSQTKVSLSQQDSWIPPAMSDTVRLAAAEGIVLLRNDRAVLPLAKGAKVSVFGRVQFDYFAVGYGSGGDVNEPYLYNLIDGLVEDGSIQINETICEIYREWIAAHPRDDGFWGHWPRYHEEMPITAELAEAAAESSDTAIYVIGRSSGEDRENALEQGSYYLTDTERDVLEKLCAGFRKVVVLINGGSVIDTSWLQNLPETDLALLYVWQGGMESGRAIADVLTGKVSPSGKLADTVAWKYEDLPASANFGAKEYNNYAEDIFVGYRYFETFAPEKVQFPFGFGLSYTSFSITTQKASVRKGVISLTVQVTNTGSAAGKEVVQVYYGAPVGQLAKPAKSLAAYAKTKELAPNQSQTLRLAFPAAHMASYDDGGKTGNRSCYVLEAGEYPIYVGNSVRDCAEVYRYTVQQLTVTEALSEQCAPEASGAFARLTAVWGPEKAHPAYEPVPLRRINRKERILSALPEALPDTGDMGYRLSDVASGRITLEKFTAQLSPKELEALTRGDYIMNSSLGAPGNAAVYGGVEASLRQRGVSPVTATDGPSGIRLAVIASLLPIGTALACSWNAELVEKVYDLTGQEMAKKGSHVLLAPGMNIHRDPLCGRNFEYFSEDPLLTGTMGAAVVSGVQKNGVSACPKHFACNSQETNRTHTDSRVSERALREIYLKGFEICVKTARPRNIMTSYNKINGTWAHYHYELVNGILRGEWGYAGCVMTDWWMRAATDPDFPKLRDNAYRVRAGVDVLMPGAAPGTRHAHYDGSLLESLGKKGGITLGEIQQCAMHTLRFVLQSYPFCMENGGNIAPYEKGEPWFTASPVRAAAKKE